MHSILDNITTVKCVSLLVIDGPAVVGSRVTLLVIGRFGIVDIDSAELVGSFIAIPFENPRGCDRDNHQRCINLASVIIHECKVLAVQVFMRVLAAFKKCQFWAKKWRRISNIRGKVTYHQRSHQNHQSAAGSHPMIRLGWPAVLWPWPCLILFSIRRRNIIRYGIEDGPHLTSNSVSKFSTLTGVRFGKRLSNLWEGAARASDGRRQRAVESFIAAIVCVSI